MEREGARDGLPWFALAVPRAVARRGRCGRRTIVKKRIVASLAVVPALLLLLSGCGGSSGDEYIGEWSSPKGTSGRLEIARQGESTFTVEQAPGGSGFPGFSAVATLNDDGILVVEVGGGKVPLVVDEASGRLTFNRQEYIRFLRLFEAAAEGDTAVVKALLEAGAEVDAKCPDQSYCGRIRIDNPNPDEPLFEAFGATALVIAAATGRADAVKALLEAGADVDAKTSDGTTALIVAAYGMFKTPPETPKAAARGGHADTVKALLEAGADVDAKTSNGTTALIAAADFADAVKMLLEAGADVDAKDEPLGETALMWAVGLGDADAFKALLEAGAEVNATTSEGNTALLLAAEEGSAEMVKALLEAGADADAKRPDGETALLTAVGKGHAATAKALLEGGADMKGISGETAVLMEILLGPMPFRDCDECPEMVVVPSGSFRMGSSSRRARNERPAHEVRIGSPFAVGVYEVTFSEWDACATAGGCGGYRPGDRGWGRGDRPVINVSWRDAKSYVEWLSGRTGKRYRLLSESEWEYAARSGTRTRYSWGDEIGDNRANCDGCGSQWDDRSTAPVGSFAANPWGLHDMHGNVREWVEDCWNGNYKGAPSDGSAWESGNCSQRVLRDGSWGGSPSYLRAAYRFRDTTIAPMGWGVTAGLRNDSIGFRVARTLAP